MLIPNAEVEARIRRAAALLDLDVEAFVAGAADDWARTVIAEYAETPPPDRERRSTIAALRVAQTTE